MGFPVHIVGVLVGVDRLLATFGAHLFGPENAASGVQRLWLRRPSKERNVQTKKPHQLQLRPRGLVAEESPGVVYPVQGPSYE